MRMRTLAIALGLTLAVGAPVQAQQAAATPPPIRIDDTMAPLAKPVPDAAELAEFDAFVEGVRKQFEVPGIAVAIVQDGKIVMERGYGVRELGKPAKVDEHTMFAIASNTKAFTAAALVGAFGVGVYMSDLPLSPTRLKLYNWHKWAGVTILALSIVRLLWRLGHRPPPDPPMPAWQARAAHASTP